MANDQTDPVTPIPHLNGTALERLLQDRKDAANALRRALTALADTAPNGRDYYLTAEGRFEKAKAQHARRVDAVAGVLAELEREMRILRVGGGR